MQAQDDTPDPDARRCRGSRHSAISPSSCRKLWRPLKALPIFHRLKAHGRALRDTIAGGTLTALSSRRCCDSQSRTPDYGSATRSRVRGTRMLGFSCALRWRLRPVTKAARHEPRIEATRPVALARSAARAARQPEFDRTDSGRSCSPAAAGVFARAGRRPFVRRTHHCRAPEGRCGDPDVRRAPGEERRAADCE